jgi:hypothetical protein
MFHWITKAHSIALFTAAFVLALGSFTAAEARPEIGQPAPDFEVVDTTGTTHQLADFEGQTLVLEWTNHDCPFVQKHYESGNMQDQQRAAINDHGVVWLTVISSSPGTQGHVSPTQADALTVSRNASPTAVLYIIDEASTLVYMGGIDSNPSANPDDIPAATQYVMEGLEAMAADEPIGEPITRPYGCSIKYAD